VLYVTEGKQDKRRANGGKKNVDQRKGRINRGGSKTESPRNRISNAPACLKRRNSWKMNAYNEEDQKTSLRKG